MSSTVSEEKPKMEVPDVSKKGIEELVEVVEQVAQKMENGNAEVNETPANPAENEQETVNEGSSTHADGGPSKRSVAAIIGKVRNDTTMSEDDKIDTLSVIVQKFFEENARLRGDLDIMDDNLKKHEDARKAMKSLNDAYKKQMELVKEEHSMRMQEEEVKRKQTMNGYSSSISELTGLLETQQGMNGRMKDDNGEMMDQMKLLIGETEKREKAIQRMQTEFELQLKLLEHQVAKAQIEKAEIKADMTKERLEIVQELTLERERSKNLEETVVLLKEQAEIFQQQLDEGSAGLGKDNKSFQHFKTQIDKLTSQMVKLEKDTQEWRQKYELSNQQVKKMNTASMDSEKEVTALKKKLDSMVKLNKTLAQERTTLTEKVKSLEGKA